jgi:signal peptidase I
VAIRAYGVEAFKVPAGSMAPALLVGDHFVAEKRRPGAPLPNRGDIVVFPFPENPAQDFVKRVIALPGDKLEVKNGRPVLNGWEVPRCLVGKATMTEADGAQGELYMEYLDDAAYLVFLRAEQPEDTFGPFVAAQGEVWVLGDNRFASHDSPHWRGGLGAGVPVATIKGRFMVRFMSPGPDRFGTGNEPVLPPSMKDLQPEVDRCLAQRPPRNETTPPSSK